jgi:UDP-2,4-diacetamido-2,4,6-trideoxy-beta-L-altropyranose hydrolase
MRCLALANACRNFGAKTQFIGSIEDEVLVQRIISNKHEFISLDSGFGCAWPESLDDYFGWVVLDGYDFDSSDQVNIQKKGYKLMVIDDMAHLDIYYADVILNQNFSAHPGHYRLGSAAQMLMGPNYALLRKEFLGRSQSLRQKAENRLLITLGGSDPQGVIFQLLDALDLVDQVKLEIKVIAGSSSFHLNRLKDYADHMQKTGVHYIEIERFTNDMPSKMLWADFAIIAGGSTTLEAAYMGLPVLVITMANNQAAIAEAMGAAGAAIPLGWHSDLSARSIANEIYNLVVNDQVRHGISLSARTLVDGYGADRVAQILLN